ncbi:LLM class flavin-dependent oxidoreductase [Alkalihalobacterium alkalinitrilicum]|uniref:LLM class flavin-dependent oxidoreductase n=1 Tax=Alkalihalobacterium alkalinitrilicum TaxID=427920 RepID=UPI000995768C|nr:LLM class flavin-dependent oxidoreductase [Alkalihalobacterium alkalinitrilicum]
MKLSLWLITQKTPISKVTELAEKAEKNGFDAVWFAEAWRETIVPLTAIAMKTKTIKFGSGVGQVFPNNPTTLALQGTNLQELSDGRFVLGLGLSTPFVVENWYGSHYGRPLRQMRESIEIIKGIQTSKSGNRFNYEGELFKIKKYKSPVELEKPFPVYMAAIGPKMLQLAGEIADGLVIGALHSPRYLSENVYHNLKIGAERSGRNLDDLNIIYGQICSISQNRKEAYDRARKSIMYTAQYPHYQTVMQQEGFTEEVEAISQALEQKDYDKAATLITDKMVDHFSIAGEPDECKEKLLRYSDYPGIPMLTLIPFKVSEEEVIDNMELILETFKK